MKTVDYSDCKTVFSLQFSKDAPSEGPMEPTKPCVPVRCWRGQVPAAAVPPLNPPGCGFSASSSSPGHLPKQLGCCASARDKLQLLRSVPGPEAGLRRGTLRGHRGLLLRGPSAPIHGPAVTHPPASGRPGPRRQFSFSITEDVEEGEGTVNARESGNFVENKPVAPLCHFGWCERQKERDLRPGAVLG